MVIVNSQKSHFFSKVSGEGGMDPIEKRRQKNTRRREDAGRRAQAAIDAEITAMEEQLFGDNAQMRAIVTRLKDYFKAQLRDLHRKAASEDSQPPTAEEEKAILSYAANQVKDSVGPLEGMLEPVLSLVLIERQMRREAGERTAA